MLHKTTPTIYTDIMKYHLSVMLRLRTPPFKRLGYRILKQNINSLICLVTFNVYLPLLKPFVCIICKLKFKRNQMSPFDLIDFFCSLSYFFDMTTMSYKLLVK